MFFVLKTAVAAVGFVWNVVALAGGAAVFWFSAAALLRKPVKKPLKFVGMFAVAAAFGGLSAAYGAQSIASTIGII